MLLSSTTSTQQQRPSTNLLKSGYSSTDPIESSLAKVDAWLASIEGSVEAYDESTDPLSNVLVSAKSVSYFDGD